MRTSFHIQGQVWKAFFVAILIIGACFLTGCGKSKEDLVIGAVRTYVSDPNHHLEFYAWDGNIEKVYSHNLTIKSVTEQDAFVQFATTTVLLTGEPEQSLKLKTGSYELTVTWACFHVSHKNGAWTVESGEDVHPGILGAGDCSSDLLTPQPTDTPEPTPTPTPTSTPTPTPAPAREVVTNPDGLSIKVLRTNWDAWSVIHDTNSNNDPPPAGGIDILIEMTLTNNSAKEIEFDKMEFALADKNNNEYHTIPSVTAPYHDCGLIPSEMGYSWDSNYHLHVDNTLSAGESMTGTICIQAPSEVTDWILVYPGMRVELPMQVPSPTTVPPGGSLTVPNGLAVEITSVNWDAWDTVLRAIARDQEFDGPAFGMKYMLIDFTLTNQGKSPIAVNIGDLVVIDPKGEEIVSRCDSSLDLDPINLPRPLGKGSDHISLNANDQVSGQLCYEFALGNGEYLLRYGRKDAFTDGFTILLPQR